MAARLIEPIVLCFVVKQDAILLLKRISTKKVFPLKWDAIGGKIEPGETPLQACIREVKEETGLDVIDPQLCSIVTVMDHQYECERLIFVFRATQYHGQVFEQCDEGDLSWMPLSKIPHLDIIPDIPYYIKTILTHNNQINFENFTFDKNGEIQVANS